MTWKDVFDRYLDKAPICVMVRATLEWLLSAETLDGLFHTHSEAQYERELLFSSVVDVMGPVVCRTYRSVSIAYQKQEDTFPVSRKSLYNKINGIELNVSRALVRHTADGAAKLVDKLGARQALLPGYRIKVIDGNHLSGTDHRLGVLRDEGAAALPGMTVAVLDPQRRIFDDVVSSEYAYTQETQLLEPIVERIEPKDVLIADRLYCTSDLLFETDARKAFFVVRQHLGHLRWTLKGRRRFRGTTESGRLYEQQMEITHPQTGKTMRLRRITVQLDQPTRDGDEELHILTNLPDDVADAESVAHLYRQRWTVETAFQQLTTELCCELTTLGYPPAALFSFSMAAASYNVFAVILAALRSVHGEETVEANVSSYYLTDELSGTYRGMMIALPPKQWKWCGRLTAVEFAEQLQEWSRAAKLFRYQKHRRGPKTGNTRPSAPGRHLATSRKLEEAKKPP